MLALSWPALLLRAMSLNLPDNFPPCAALQLWFARVGELTACIEQSVQTLFSQSEHQRLEATSNSNKRREYLLSRALMRHALTQQFGYSKHHWHFIEQANQAPTITNLPDHVFFSLTHSKGSICFALASYPVGVDLEKIRENRDFKSLAKAMMSTQEITLLEQQPDKLAENFYRNWCAKEAYYKMLPNEQQSRLTLKELSVPPLQPDTEKITLLTKRSTEYMLAVVSQKKCQQTSYHAFPAGDKQIKQFSESFI